MVYRTGDLEVMAQSKDLSNHRFRLSGIRGLGPQNNTLAREILAEKSQDSANLLTALG